VTIICKDHGEFQQKPSVHLLCKIGCPICGDKSSRENHKTTIEEFIQQKHSNKHINVYSLTISDEGHLVISNKKLDQVNANVQS
jgi:hypothetical protein